MAALRSSNITAVLNDGTRRKAMGAKDVVRQTQRAVLGNISNVNVNNVVAGGKNIMQLKKTVKNMAVEELKEVIVPNDIVEKVPVEEVSLEQMDISVIELDNSQLDETEMVEEENKQEEVVIDIDADDGESPQLMPEYVIDVYEYLRSLEVTYAVGANCMSKQIEVTYKMRAILIDWMVQVHKRFDLLQETLLLAVNILDRYFQCVQVPKDQLQLVGVTSLWIAAKYEEMYAPEIADFIYITDNAYSKPEMRQMERDVMTALEFRLGNPLPIHFLRRFSKAAQVEGEVHTMAKYLIELSMVEYDMTQYLPSKIAASSLYLAMLLLNDVEWNATLRYYSNYTEADMEEVIRKLADILINANGNSKLMAVKNKYASSRFYRISRSEQLNSSLVAELAGRSQSS